MGNRHPETKMKRKEKHDRLSCLSFQGAPDRSRQIQCRDVVPLLTIQGWSEYVLYTFHLHHRDHLAHKTEPLLNGKLRYGHEILDIHRERHQMKRQGNWGGPDHIKSDEGVRGGEAVGYVQRGLLDHVDNCALWR